MTDNYPQTSGRSFADAQYPDKKDGVKPMTPIRKDEIASHSSVLTNDRIDNILRAVDNWKINSWIIPSEENVRHYFANVFCLFDNVFMILTADARLIVDNGLRDYLTLWFKLVRNEIEGEDQKKLTLWHLLTLLDAINWEIRGDLQKYQYFFRTEVKDIKKVEEALIKLKEGGGIFGGVPGIPK